MNGVVDLFGITFDLDAASTCCSEAAFTVYAAWRRRVPTRGGRVYMGYSELIRLGAALMRKRVDAQKAFLGGRPEPGRRQGGVFGVRPYEAP